MGKCRPSLALLLGLSCASMWFGGAEAASAGSQQESIGISHTKHGRKSTKRGHGSAKHKKEAHTNTAVAATNKTVAALDEHVAEAPAAAPAPGTNTTQLVEGKAPASAVTTSATNVSEVEPVWIFCALQWQPCACNGKIRWGNKDTWKVIAPKNGSSKQKVKCDITTLGDVLPGDSGKHCQCAVTPGTAFYKSLNPSLLPPEESKDLLVTSCDILKADAQDGPWGAKQWEAVEGMCSPAPQLRQEGLGKSGPRTMSPGDMRDSMRSWVDPRFTANYRRFYGNGSGWTPRAFVNYYAGPPSEKHAQMTEALIESVHAFSKEPIVVFHFGMSTPKTWSPERFPQLVLLHASPLPSESGRSFNFNKFRAMLLARARIGMALDSDQFVAPRVDDIFATTEREVTKDYPMPILPAHFLDRGPQDGGAYWKRFCPGGKCKFQTVKWGHAHPTWTFWALPFVGRWLRRNFRDEWLPARHGGEMAALRVTAVPEDEDILNIATWEEGGTKQWCKFDLPGPSDFYALLQTKPGQHCSVACGNVARGVAKVFYTAHHAVDPRVTRDYIARLKERVGKLPPPIMYGGRFYKTGEELRKANPDIRCII